MGYKTISNEDNICEFVLDSEEDVAQLPKCAPSSMAIVVTEGLPIYMVNASGEWVKI